MLKEKKKKKNTHSTFFPFQGISSNAATRSSIAAEGAVVVSFSSVSTMISPSIRMASMGINTILHSSAGGRT